MKKLFTLALFIVAIKYVNAQIDPSLLRRVPKDTTAMQFNMDAVYNRPFLKLGKLPVAIGGYAEANYQYLRENGISEGHQFQMRRVSVFISSAIANRIKFLSENIAEHNVSKATKERLEKINLGIKEIEQKIAQLEKR